MKVVTLIIIVLWAKPAFQEYLTSSEHINPEDLPPPPTYSQILEIARKRWSDSRTGDDLSKHSDSNNSLLSSYRDENSKFIKYRIPVNDFFTQIDVLPNQYGTEAIYDQFKQYGFTFNENEVAYSTDRSPFSYDIANYNQYNTLSDPNRNYGLYDNNMEHTKYVYSYKVLDQTFGNDYGHTESRDGNGAWGKYYVLLPNGRKQVVTYTADENGYYPEIMYEEERPYLN